MNRTEEQIRPAVRSPYAELAGTMRQFRDPERARKIGEVGEKLERGRLYAAFLGHFSAGKSSLINKLCGRRLLPSGPIPTSANMVTIHDGPEGASLFYVQGDNGEPAPPRKVPLDRLEEYCRMGGQIRTVEIACPLPWLGERLALLDTPGIDSADDAHKEAAENALYLADAVFYVMDYHHVQSEFNFQFLKDLQDLGKPLYLLINQIDKHRERELPFADFRARLEQSFRDWRIHPVGLLYISVKEEQAPHNEWPLLLELLGAMKERAADLVRSSAAASAEGLIEEHLAYRFRDERAGIKELQAEASELGQRLAADLAASRGLRRLAEGRWMAQAAPEEQLRILTDYRGHWADAVRAETSAILDSAILMPAYLRDLAQAYLESLQPGFKAGLWPSRSKTERERKQRLAVFHEKLAELVENAVTIHVREMFRKKLADLRAPMDEASAVIGTFAFRTSPEWLASEARADGVSSDAYTFVYTKQLAEAIKRRVRQESAELAERLLPLVERALQPELAGLEALRGAATAIQEKRAAAERLNAGIVRAREEMTAALSRALAETGAAAGRSEAEWPDPRKLPVRGHDADSMRSAGAVKPAQEQETGPREPGSNAPGVPGAAAGAGVGASAGIRTDSPAACRYDESRERLQSAAGKLTRAADLLEEAGGFGDLIRAMRAKAGELADSRFTVALFGAFSAGKSSFANALLGQALLPVSPNPTTAAINRILPADMGNPHGTAKIVLKSREAVLSDVRYSQQALGLPDDLELPELFERIRRPDAAETAPGGRPHVAFLRAAADGWAAAEANFGRTLTADYETYREYAAVERASAFVERIDLFADSALGGQGIQLVDTPGADSVNARHTGVAFDYIKNADAILFVTYYNHAFSQADREFLRQLGKVKDSFELDKMFFVVNAADLADSADECGEVVRHLRDNLLKFGIRSPRIYPVSSRLAMEAHLMGAGGPDQASGLPEFNQDFHAFLSDELANLAVSAALQSVRLASDRLERLIGQSAKQASEREREAELLQTVAGQAGERLSRFPMDAERQQLAQEIRELLYHIRQRIMYRFGEFYQMAFNPAALHAGVRDIRQALRSAWHEWVQLTETELSRELLATTLRLERKVRALTAAWSERAAAAAQAELPEALRLGGFDDWTAEGNAVPQPHVEEPSGQSEPDEKLLLAHYRNPARFFEGDGSAKLREALEPVARSLAEGITERHEARFLASYDEALCRLIRHSADRLAEQLGAYAESFAAASREGNDPERLRRMREVLLGLLA